jgi:hypothetical protein
MDCNTTLQTDTFMVNKYLQVLSPLLIIRFLLVRSLVLENFENKLHYDP